MKYMIVPVIFFLFTSTGYANELQSDGQAAAKQYYISNRGNDNNPGTRTKPFRSLAKMNSLNLQPGTRIYLMGGESFEGTLSLNLEGTRGKPIIITSYGTGRATIYSGDKEAVIIRGSYFRLSNIDTKGAGRKEGNITSGIRVIEANNGSVENINTAGFQKSGLELYNCKNMVVKKIKALDNGFCGIYVIGAKKTESENILVKDCHAENNAGDPTNLDNHSGNGILVGNSSNVTIDHCTATNNGWDMPRIGNGPVGIWAYEADHIIIQYCISYRNKTAKGAKDGGGFDLDGGVTNSVIQYCLSYENEGAGHGLFQYAGASPWYNNTIRYCISINDAASTEGSGSFFVWNNSDDSTQLKKCIVHNNVVYSTHAPAIQFDAQSPNSQFYFYNNIFIGTGQIVNGPSSGEHFTGNIWWTAGNNIQFRGYKDLAAWADSTGQEKLNNQIAGKQADPLLQGPFTTGITDPYQLSFLSGYKLQAASPLINSGLNLLKLFHIPFAAHDFYGNKIPQGTQPEPGVHELE